LPTVDHLDPPDLPRHGCNSDRGPAASGGLTVLANDRNGGRLRLNASRRDDDDDEKHHVGRSVLYKFSLGQVSCTQLHTALFHDRNSPAHSSNHAVLIVFIFISFRLIL